MKRGTFPFKLTFALLCLVAMGAVAVFSQPAAPGQSFIVTPSQVIVQPAQPRKQDPFDSLITSAASFDIDSPVVVRAEFDPPLAVLGQRVVYRIEVSALAESLKVPDQLPSPAGMAMRAGGHGQIYQPTGTMKLQPRTSFLYHVSVTNTGSFSMPPFDVLAYGKSVRVPATSLTVVPAGGANVREPPQLLVELPPGDIYVGQSLRVALLMPDAAEGNVQGFMRSHITGEFIFSEVSMMGMRHEMIQRNGKSFPATVEELVLTPLREGRQEIIAQAYVPAMRPMPGHSNIIMNYPILIDAEPARLNVKGLPEQGKLPGFTGAVGIFQMDPPRPSTNDARAGDPMTLTVTLRGEGNLGRLTPPPAPVLKEWQVFPPATESLPPVFVQQRGFVNFTYTLIPLSDQIKATPTIPFSYFDPIRKMYVDLTVPATQIKITAGELQPNTSRAETDASAGAEKEPVLTGLTNEPGGTIASLTPLQKRTWFLILQVVPAAVLGGLWFWDSRRRYREQHPEVILKRRARRGLRRQLRLARRAAATGDAAGFATRATDALREACAPHNAAHPGALVCADVLRELPGPEQEGRGGNVVRRLFAAADALRFGGPDRNGKDLLALQPELERLLAKMKERL